MKVKVIDLLNKIANGEEVPIVKFKLNQHRFKYNKKDKMFDDIDDFSRCKCSIEFCELDDELEIIEEQQEIEELENWYVDEKEEYREFDIQAINLCFKKHQEKINEIVQAVKQLDKKIKDKE